MIHATAIIDDSAAIDPSAEIGAYTCIGANVTIGAKTVVGPHVVIKGATTIGEENHIFQFCSIGEDPQDKKYAGENTRLEIGDRNTIREYVTMNRGTSQDRGVTSIGNDCLFMAYTHVAHDCIVHNHVTMANAASIAGHVTVGTYAILGGFTIVHQFCRVGCHSFIGMGGHITRDVPPYVTVGSQPTKPRGINQEGLKRRDYDKDQIAHIRRAFKTLYKAGHSLKKSTELLKEQAEECQAIAPFVEFLEGSERSILR
ncbi:MAG: acyl-ACP--UDP-N-acetylglucosamine O-acyltransferase [Methylococcales bacterium]|nr:acyl-ACP--UDP-N-acetylglucosamine O-acyltransferase [Methylococcales bacterium]